MCSFSAGLLNLVSLTFLHVYDSSHTCDFGESYFIIISASDKSQDVWHHKSKEMTNDAKPW